MTDRTRHQNLLAPIVLGIKVLLLALVLGLSLGGMTTAMATDGPAFALPNAETAGPDSSSGNGTASTLSNSSAPNAITYWILQQQRSLHRSLSDSMATIDAEDGWGPVGLLIALSFFYGIFHAAGPGHGKAVITTYLLTQPTALRRGVVLSVLAALMQGVTAILLVVGFVLVLGRLAREAVDSVQTVEQISFALIALLGIVVIWRTLSPMVTAWHHARSAGHIASGRSPQPAFTPAPAAMAVHRQAMPGDPPAQLSSNSTFTQATVSTNAPMSDQACPSCGKVHHVGPDQVKDKSVLQSAWLILAIGARPCAGAVLVLAVANLLGLWWAGILGVLAMSLGTAITVTTLATLAVTARGLATRLLRLQGGHLLLVSRVTAVVGGLILLFLGMTLLQGSIQMPRATGIL